MSRARWRRTLIQRLNFYRLRAKVIVEDLSETLGVLAIWDGSARHVGWPVLRRPTPAGAGHALHAAAASCRQASGRSRRATGGCRASTKPTGSRSACRAAGSISATAMPSRTKPTWTSSTASISTRAAMSVRRSSRAWQHRGTPRTRVVPVSYRRRRAGSRCAGAGRRQERRHDGLGGRTDRALP